MMPQENDVEHHRYRQAQNRDDPDNQREQHANQNDCLLIILLGKSFHINEELHDRRSAFGGRMFALRYEIQLHDRVESNGIDHLARPIRKNNTQPCFTRVSETTLGLGRGFSHSKEK